MSEATGFIAEIAGRARARIAELRPDWEAAHRVLAAATGETYDPAPALEAEREVARLESELQGAREEITTLQGYLNAQVGDRQSDDEVRQRQIAELEAELDKQASLAHTANTEEIPALRAHIAALEAENAVLKAGFGKRGAPPEDEPEPEPPAEAPIPELESEDKGQGTPEHELESAPEDPAEAVSSQRRSPSITLELVRDTIREHFGHGEEFNLKMLKEKLDTQSSTVSAHVKTLAGTGALKRSGGLAGPSVRYRFVKPSSNGGPQSRPRGEHLHVVPTQVSKDRGKTVAGTGKPKGPAETPGKLKRQQQKAARVKPKRVGGVRL